MLAYLTDRVLVPYRFRLPECFSQNHTSGRWPEPLLLPDLFDIPVPWSDEYVLKTWISVPGALHCAWQPVFDSVFRFSAMLPDDDKRFRDFRNGRQRYTTSISNRKRRRTCTSRPMRLATIPTSFTR